MNDSSVISKLEEVVFRFEEVGKQIVDPDVISDMKRYVQLNREYKDLSPVVDAYKNYKDVIDNIASAKDIIKLEKDEEFKEMAKMELEELLTKKEELDEEIKWLLIPKDPNDNKNVIMEIRAGTGGDEACIFVEDVYRMFTMFFKEKGWSAEVINTNEGTVKGFK